MKVRAGFVSNSSSSSFLVVYKSLKDFEKMNRFEGYKKFTKDLSGANPVLGLAVLRGVLFIEEFNTKIFNKFPDKQVMLVGTEDRYRSCMSAKENKFINACRSESSHKFYDEKFRVALNKKIDKLADTLLRKLHSKGYTVRAVIYEDDSQEGAMMEHGFMPFIANNPEREYEIFQVNEH